MPRKLIKHKRYGMGITGKDEIEASIRRTMMKRRNNHIPHFLERVATVTTFINVLIEMYCL